jgi:predicted alpha/beta superfamily hydrolase
MKKLILLLAFVCSAGMHAQKIVTQVSSPRLKENREITIGLPASYDKNPDKKYPLLVLLDGDYLFDPFKARSIMVTIGKTSRSDHCGHQSKQKQRARN